MNEAQIIVTGNVANKPSLGTTPAGVPVANMRVGYTPRRLDRESGQWVDGQTSWLTVKCWRKLADHVAMCLNKGDPVLVRGVLQVRQYTDKDGNPRQAVEVLASAVGHDLNRGVTHFTRTGRTSGPVLPGAQGEAAGGSGQAGPELTGSKASAHHDGMRRVPAPAWDPARNGGTEEPDDDMFGETAVVAAALHAVPDLEDSSDAGDEEPGIPAGGTGSQPGSSPGTDAGGVPKDPAPADRRPGRIPVQRKPAARKPPREGGTGDADRARDSAGAAGSPGTDRSAGADAVPVTGAGPSTRDSSRSSEPAPLEPSLT